MILTREDLKHLEAYDEETYVFTGGNVTKSDREKLLELDESYLFLNGKHLIRNINEL